ncbi:MAG: altronate hydrolase [Gemmatimonadetes bacterium]|nr:altronate hydrolase [Gemmatimonadota bacterium]
MKRVCDFDEVGRLPMAGDNVAIATRRLATGTEIRFQGTCILLDSTVMEGHRFAVRPIPAGEDLLSWNLPFGRATRAIEPGAYVCNRGMLEALGGRDLDFELPVEANFEDRIERYELDGESFRPGRQVDLYDQTGTFSGYDRGPQRGVGTRNYVVVVGTSSRTASFARLLASRLRETTAGIDSVDGVVAVDHTEGGGIEDPNNRKLVLRALAGFAVHPNIGALLAVDYGVEAITNRMLQEYMAAHDYPLDQVPHRFMTLRGSFADHLNEGERQIRTWLENMGGERRSEQPLSQLKIALQCGGSDAFSGISGNPLAAWAARELIRHGGTANLAETDELIGAEPYVLQNVRDAETARRFLEGIERFKERVAWHGESAEGNPSGGNKFRGLYNIALKSIGAARKRNPDVRLDYCIDYAQPMTEPGYYFMDSPGNDLESIAGQVAAGCNAIYFVTGNGSVTNFPFVPTLKIVTTTSRYELLAEDMDVNAGAYQDGVPMDELGRKMFDLTLQVAAGTRSKGERAGHAQVQIWRNWPQRDGSQLERLRSLPAPEGKPLGVKGSPEEDTRFSALRIDGRNTTDQIGLILPTSLCSAQVARLAAERLNATGLGRAKGISRFVPLLHTEGCGGTADEIYSRTMLGYLTHPLVRCALLLEHGCEKTHNDYMRNELTAMGFSPESFGWASVQMDGGIEKALARVERWFTQHLEGLESPPAEEVGLGALRLGLLSSGPLDPQVAHSFAHLARRIVGAGGTVVVPERSNLLNTGSFVGELLEEGNTEICLAYGQPAPGPGFFVMENPTDHWVETLTGLGATGMELLLAHVGEHPAQGHPLVPLMQVSSAKSMLEHFSTDLDLELTGPTDLWSEQLLELICRIASRQQRPRAMEQHNTDFQLTRGLLGVSM